MSWKGDVLVNIRSPHSVRVVRYVNLGGGGCSVVHMETRLSGYMRQIYSKKVVSTEFTQRRLIVKLRPELHQMSRGVILISG